MIELRRAKALMFYTLHNHNQSGLLIDATQRRRLANQSDADLAPTNHLSDSNKDINNPFIRNHSEPQKNYNT